MKTNLMVVLTYIAGGISFFEYAVYIYDIFERDTRPSRSSWWILSIVWIVFFASSLSLAPGYSFIEKFHNLAGGSLFLTYIAGSIIIAVLSVKYGSRDKINKLDVVCATLTMCSLVLFFITTKIYSLIAAIIADFFAILPTIKNAYKYPHQESLRAWILCVIASTIALFAVNKWDTSFESFSDWSNPVYLTVINLIILSIMFFRRSYVAEDAGLEKTNLKDASYL